MTGEKSKICKYDVCYSILLIITLRTVQYSTLRYGGKAAFELAPFTRYLTSGTGSFMCLYTALKAPPLEREPDTLITLGKISTQGSW